MCHGEVSDTTVAAASGLEFNLAEGIQVVDTDFSR
jgi:hypothetical protein